jgi:Zn-finger nucleic acid-binding protein
MKRKTNVEEKMSLELKYCERCGGLWLRPAGGGQVYCASCAKQMAEMPPASGRFDSSAEESTRGETVIREADEFYSKRMFGVLAGGEF